MQTAKLRMYMLALTLTLAVHIDVGAVTMFGVISCGDWVKNVREKNLSEDLQSIWLNGYLSGAASASGDDVLKGASTASLLLWVTNYCNINPLENSSAAGNELFLELKKKMKK